MYLKREQVLNVQWCTLGLRRNRLCSIPHATSSLRNKIYHMINRDTADNYHSSSRIPKFSKDQELPQKINYSCSQKGRYGCGIITLQCAGVHTHEHGPRKLGISPSPHIHWPSKRKRRLNSIDLCNMTHGWTQVMWVFTSLGGEFMFTWRHAKIDFSFIQIIRTYISFGSLQADHINSCHGRYI